MTDRAAVDWRPHATHPADRQVAADTAATLARLLEQIEEGRVTATASQRVYLAGAADALRALAESATRPPIR